MLKRQLPVIAGVCLLASALHAQSLSLSSATASLTGGASLNLTLASGTNSIAAMQWTFQYPAATISSLSATAGPVLTAVGKSLTCTAGTGSYTCIAFGLNATTIADGVVAIITVTASQTSALSVVTTVASSAAGSAVSLAGSGGTVTVGTAGPLLSSLTCSAAPTIGPSSVICTVTLSSASPAAGVVLALSSNNLNLTVPASITVPAGALSASFSATTTGISSDQSAVITAAANGFTQSATLALSAAANLTSLACNPASLPTGKSATCTVTLSKAAPAAGAVVSLSGGTTALSIPTSVTIAGGTASATFAVTASGITTQTMVVSGSYNGASVSFILTVTPPPPTLSILGSAAEVSGVSNGSMVTPTIGPAGFTGTVVVNQTGTVTFAPDASGNGVYFQNCCANNNNAYYRFTGTGSGASSISRRGRSRLH